MHWLIDTFVPTQEDVDEFKDAMIEYTSQMWAMLLLGWCLAGACLFAYLAASDKGFC